LRGHHTFDLLMIFDIDMSGEGPVVGNDDVIANDTIMPDVCVSHKETMISDSRRHSIRSAFVDGSVLANGRIVAYDRGGLLPLVFKILINHTDNCAGIDFAVLADGGIRI